MVAYEQEVVNDTEFKPFSSFVFCHFWKEYGLDTLSEIHLRQFMDVINIHKESCLTASLFLSFLHSQYSTADLLYYLFLRRKLAHLCLTAHVPCYRVDIDRTRRLPVATLEFPTHRPHVMSAMAAMPDSFRDTLDRLADGLWTPVRSPIVDPLGVTSSPIVAHPGTVRLNYSGHTLRARPKRAELVVFLTAATEAFHREDGGAPVFTEESIKTLQTAEYGRDATPSVWDGPIKRPLGGRSTSPPFKGPVWESFQDMLHAGPSTATTPTAVSASMSNAVLLRDAQPRTLPDRAPTRSSSTVGRVRFLGTVQEVAFSPDPKPARVEPKGVYREPDSSSDDEYPVVEQRADLDAEAFGVPGPPVARMETPAVFFDPAILGDVLTG